MINLLMFIFLGFIQGIAEPIPVSSSGHLLIFQKLIGSIDKIDFEILATITNFGSFFAIVLVYKNEIIKLITSFFKYLKSKEKTYYNDYKYCWCIVLGTIPAGIVGLIVTKLELFDFLEENVKFVGAMLLVTALFLFIIKDFVGKKDKDKVTFKDALVIGVFQIIALLPGISRSGSTIIGGMFRNLKRETAFDFSFMLYLPISIATGLLGIKDLLDDNLSSSEIFMYLISAVMAFIFTYISIKWFKEVVKKGKLIYFVIYCLIVGSLVIIFL